MIKEQPYRPHPLHISADFERADTCAPRSSMNPHPGICPACATATGYRYASPIGEMHHSVTGHAQWVHTAADRTGSPTTANYSLLTANWESYLGSSSWITFTDGKAVQHLHYLPWGEDFVNQRTSSFSSMYTFSAKEKDAETGYSYFGSRYYSSDLSIWLSVDPMAHKYPSLSPYVYCADNPVKLVDPDGEEIGEPPLKRIVNLGFQSKTFQKLFRKSGLTIENMSDIISFGNQSFMNPYTKKITLRDANSDMGNVIALTHEMTNRIHAKKLKNNMESVRKGDISYETFADNAIRIESEGVANQIIVASELNYSFPDDKGVMNDLKTQYKEGTIRRREMLNTIKESDFQDEFGRNPKKDYYEQGKNIRESQIRREKQSKSGF